MSEVRCIWNAGALVGEGPIWDSDADAVYWVDIKAPAIHRYTWATGDKASWPVPEPIGCIARRRRGGFIVGLKSGFAFLDHPNGPIQRIGTPEPNLPSNRLNDGKLAGDAVGLLLSATPEESYGRPPIASRLHQDVDHVAVLVHGAPQILLPALNETEAVIEPVSPALPGSGAGGEEAITPGQQCVDLGR